jgi:hypothetical protein
MALAALGKRCLMRKFGFVVLCFCLTVGSLLVAEEMKFGEAVTIERATEIGAILAEPDAYVGKNVRVEGKVVDVCAHQGCWMEIVGDKPEHHIQAKVEDGVIVFPQEAKGKFAVVEGEVQKLELSLEQTVAYFKHQAEEKGEDFDPESVKEPRNVYRIWVHGAVVK